ncbi:CCA tRNA nucleotidyltransferase [Gloeocapsa sp. PCC 73106]|uniref:CCA tRNA nucleotidyltransferase n=1 Tax=Gloeocapsa sp. PCC 73106 TaxID=102232 RepID=UPI0002ACF8B7|nr:CCA tRNA nucleotidyltransferase [Gloeocapsa sp. PCC 73106]ELR98255.1 tRNA nucleotidyltransferase/poly(A) polymerase [Gloeocapsa sp. PCC 73106]
MSLVLPEKWPFSLDWLPPSAHLVGGAVRDALLGRKSDYLDLDFVIPTGAIALAQKIAQYYSAGFVILDPQRQIARVVFPQATVDFAQQEGDTLETDLGRRDFTVNAIALYLPQQTLIDPLKGLIDLEKKQLKMISVANLESDPLRLLRAYRQGAQLNFTIEAQTRIHLRDLAPLLIRVAPERVQSELNYLFANPHGSYWLEQAGLDGLLNVWLPNVNPTKLAQLAQIDTILPRVESTWSSINWQSEVSPLAKLTRLVADHPLEAQRELIALKYPKEVFNGVKSVLHHLSELSKCSGDLREQYFFFLGINKFFPILALVALAQNIQPELVTGLINRYSDRHDLVAHPQPLVTGNDLINSLHLKPGPQIRELLTEIHIARIEGKITTPEEALDFAQHELSPNL